MKYSTPVQISSYDDQDSGRRRKENNRKKSTLVGTRILSCCEKVTIITRNMKVTVKMLHGGQCSMEVSGDTKVSEIKTMVDEFLFVAPHLQRLVFKGKTLSEEMTVDDAGITEGAKIHLMVKKGESPSPANGAGSSKNLSPGPTIDFFAQLSTFLSKHLTEEQTTKVVSEFRKNCQLMIDSMNFDDIERFAASNFTEF